MKSTYHKTNSQAYNKMNIRKIILIISILSTNVTFGQINNSGFEDWDTTYIGTYSTVLSSVFGVPNPQTGNLNNWTSGSTYGISQTSDSYSGNYSLILHNWYSYVLEWITYHDSLNSRPQYLQGYFKYNSGGVDGVSHGSINVTLLKFNGVSNDTIAYGYYQFDSTFLYTPFQVELNYISASNPDSINIYIVNADNPCLFNPVCNLLFLDNLTLTDSPLGIENINTSENIVSVFPNPANEILTIQNSSTQKFNFTLYNSFGQKVVDRKITDRTSTLNLATFVNGIYFYKVSTDDHDIKIGKIVKQ